MATETIYKLQPNRTMHLRGFDRRGSAAALHSTSTTGFKVTGVFRDPADFAVLMLWDADNFYEHYSMKYLPSFDFSGQVLTFDVAYTNLQWIESLKYPSIDWPKLDYSLRDGTSGTINLRDCITSRTGRINATQTVTVSADANSVIYDRVAISFEKYRWDYIVPGKQLVVFSYFAAGAGTNHTVTINGTTYTYTEAPGDSSAMVATGVATAAAADTDCSVTAGTPLAHQVSVVPIDNTGDTITVGASGGASDTIWRTTNAANTVAAGLRDAIDATSWEAGTPVTIDASGTGADVVLTFNASDYGAASDANLCSIQAQSKTATTTLSPDGFTAITGAVDPTATVEIDFDAEFGANSDDIRQLWLTFAPQLAAGDYAAAEWEADFTNWSVSDPDTTRSLKIAHPSKSVRVGSRQAAYTGSWVEESGFYYRGYARGTSTSGDTIVINYSCQHTHDLYVGTALYSDRGIVSVSLDGDASTNLDCYLPTEPPVVTRRQVRTSVPAGAHRVVITHTGTKNASSSGYAFYFDFLEAAVPDDVQDPAVTYTDRSPATDYDTDHAYKLSPQRLAWGMERLGFEGDWNHYVGVFWWNQRQRRGGDIHSVDVTFTSWSGLGEGGTVELQFGGTYQGDPTGSYLRRNYLPQDTNNSLAEYFGRFINGNLVGVWASWSSNVLTIASRSPIYDFTFWAFTSGSPVGSISTSGDVRAGNEGVWEIDPAATPVLNRAAEDWHADLWGEVAARSWTAVAAFSQELTTPPDDPPADVWVQRYYDGKSVLVDSGFGTEGAGFVEAYNSGTKTVTMTGHGFITGNRVNIVGRGTWTITLTDDDNFVLTTLYSGAGSAPQVGDAVNRNLQASQCAFSSVVSDYIGAAHTEMAGLMDAAGLTPWCQFGEVLHWFFSDWFSKTITGATNASPIVITCTGHGRTTGDSVLITGVGGNTAANGVHTITVVDSNRFSLDSTTGNGAYTSGGLATGGSMALYDDDQSSAANTALGRDLALFEHQDADPSVNSYADANFLRERIEDYLSAIRTTVTTAYSGAKFELLFPYDVCYKQVYWNAAYPYPQGGRLNRYINLPSSFSTRSGSGLDRLKMEALSWGASYRNVDLAKETVRFPYDVLTWSRTDTRYLLPWFNGGCPTVLEHVFTDRAATPHVNFWALDHLCLLSWPLKLKYQESTSRAL